MTVNRKLKIITFTLGGNSFQCQLNEWHMKNGTEDGEKFYTFCGPGTEGEFREDAEPDFSLELKFFADWHLNGISDYLWLNDQLTVAFVLDHHPDLIGEHVRWAGSCKIKAPDVGGPARTTERTDITIPVIGKPAYSRIP